MTPNDVFRFIPNNRPSLDSNTFVTCYLPLIGQEAFALYHYLLAFADQGLENHLISDILNHLQFGMGPFEDALSQLNAFKLVQLLQAEDTYYLRLHPVLSTEEFLSDPVYRHLLEKKIGPVALKSLLPLWPKDSRDLSKSFGQVYAKEGQPQSHRKRPSFDLDSFQSLMAREGLQFSEEHSSDPVELYALSQEYQLSWYDLFQVAKRTALEQKISLSRIKTSLEAKRHQNIEGQLSDEESNLLNHVSQHDALSFLKMLKASMKAVDTKSEREAIALLAQMGFLDEVINVLVLYTFKKTKSANLSKPYLTALANDFAHREIQTPEAAILALRQAPQPVKSSRQKSSSNRTNIPEWSNPDYKNETSQEDQAKLDAMKRQMLDQLGKE